MAAVHSSWPHQLIARAARVFRFTLAIIGSCGLSSLEPLIAQQPPGGRMVNAIAQDLRFALRQFRKAPAFTLTVIATLALGIGATTAIFSLVEGILLRPLGYRHPDRLVLVTSGATPIRFDELKKSARSYTEIGDYLRSADDVALNGAFTPEVIKQARVSANFLSILGVEPLIGRSFTAEEDSPNGPPVVIIGSNLWQR